ncbi:MAG TPA: diaminopimelate decarboxylase [Thermomicrobiales bacterium]|nr:diaminopimelate decarboxylase [Thermomicrobiales bacterium]
MIWPTTTERDERGELLIGGVSVSKLAEAAGTPLYIYDEATIRQRCRAYRDTLTALVPDVKVAYAAKAWLCKALVEILLDEGLALDVVSGGELYVALQSGMPAERISFHGNSKSLDELRMAIDAGVGAIVIDNFDELDRLSRLGAGRKQPIPVMIRINPGIDSHTHDYRKTGIVDSKFGLGVHSGDAERAVARILDDESLRLLGYHTHIGSQIFETETFAAAVGAIVTFAAAMRDRFGYEPERLSPGGGFGIPYTPDDPVIDPVDYARAVGETYGRAVAEAGFESIPQLIIEPGRSIVGNAGVAIYRVDARKTIPGVRTYVSVDGGMADNIRPALYGAVYSAELVAKKTVAPTTQITLAGKFCESGDILIRDLELPAVSPGDLIAVPASGAYCLAMASNYNMALRPAVVMVADGQARLIQRRERFEDLMARDVVENQDLSV